MSNTKTAVEKVQLKMDVPKHVKEKLEAMSAQTGFPMTLIFCMLVEYYMNSPLDVEHDVRRSLVKIAEKNKQVLKLSPRQKKVIEHVAERDTFIEDLI